MSTLKPGSPIFSQDYQTTRQNGSTNYCPGTGSCNSSPKQRQRNAPPEKVEPFTWGEKRMDTLSVGPSFCDTYPRAATQKKECLNAATTEYQAYPVTVHGSWPNKDGVSNNEQPRFCTNIPPGELPDSLNSTLGKYMPGVADGLEKCEWSKHGVCSGLSFEQYYQTVVNIMPSIENTIGSTLRDNNMLGETHRHRGEDRG
jgi:ribonuclease I